MNREPSSADANGDVPAPPDFHTAAQPVDGETPPRLSFSVVGVGASAGGLEAYTEFLKALPPDTGMAFVFIQHLSPQYESMLAEILGRHTPMPVVQVEDGVAIEPNHVYVIRPGHTMTIADGKLHLGESLLAPGHRRPVDDFFRSLANEQRERAIAVILSGMGSNGTAGAQSIKAVGGLCIAQDPESAKYPSMPRSLIDIGLADAILRPHEIPAALIRYASHPYATGSFQKNRPALREPKALTEILAILRARTQHDFTGYKKPTVIRRIERRMGLNQFTTLSDYARHFRQNPAEVGALADDLMIHVTGFFRDPDAWNSLYDRVITPLVAERDANDPLRAWVTACSTGEEAYTLAILLTEASEKAGKSFDIKIFATDTAQRSLTHARDGIFAGGIESEIAPERLDRFFDKEDAFYRVKRELRELVVFAPQNLLQDPPFSRLDICTCRNLLIYLEPDIQRRVMGLLHFGLREGGALFLGNSETIGAGIESLFEPVDKKWRIFRRIGPTRQSGIEFPLPHILAKDVLHDRRSILGPRARDAVPQTAVKILLDSCTPAAVAVDREGVIVYFHGHTERFLDQPRGEPTRDILTLARESVRGSVRNAFHRAVSQNASAHVRDGLIETPAGRMRVEINVIPLEKRDIPAYFLITFIEHPEPLALPSTEGSTEKQLRDELHRVRDELQSTIEELQSTNEEMKASSEETSSINEELQSANEELETSKEELQSLNEELTTVNTQLHAKMEEVERSHNDMASLLSSTDIAVIFLDTQFRIRRYTRATKDLFDLIPADIGRPLNDLARKFVDPDLLPDAQNVLQRLVPIEREIASKSERWYMRRTLPYRTIDNRIDGIVVTFVDITERRRSLQAQHDLEERLLWSVQASGIGHWEIELPSRLFFCSIRAQELLDLLADHLHDFSAFLAIVHPDDRPALEQAVEHSITLAGEGPFLVEFRVPHSAGGVTWLEVRGAAAFAEAPAGRTATRVRGILADITQRKLAEAALTEAKRHAEAANEAKDQFLATVSHELRTPLAAILLWAKLLESDPSKSEHSDEGLRAIIRSADSQRKLIEDLLDTARISVGKFRLEHRPVDLAALIHSCLDSTTALAKAKNIHLQSDLAPDVGLVRIDPDRIEQVLLNLLNNAVKFTPVGGQIFVGLWRRGDDVEIRVSDTGQGIAPEALPYIFDRFRQGESSPARTKGGLGLGLTICRQIIDLHHGVITASSPGADHGATFTIILPLPAVTPAVNGAPDPSGNGADTIRGLRFLLVEDDATTRKAMTLLLTQAGAVVTTAATAAEGLAAFQHERPDILLSDIGLPDEPGYALIRRIRSHEAEHHDPPVLAVALTAFTHETDRRSAAQNGFDQHIAKPVDPTQLIERLQQLRRSR